MSFRMAPAGRPNLDSYALNASKGLVVKTPPKSHITALMSGFATVRESRCSVEVPSDGIRLLLDSKTA